MICAVSEQENFNSLLHNVVPTATDDKK
jgi:hypothetical protein